MDPCECISSHQLFARRLLSLLRQSQSYCTDAECMDERLDSIDSNGQIGDNYLYFMCMIMFAMALYLLRPRTLAIQPPSPKSNNPDSNDQPPNPPSLNM